MGDHEALSRARGDLVQAPAQALEPGPGLGVDEERQGSRRVERARILKSSRAPEGDAVGLARPEDDRPDLVDDLVVVW